MIRHIVLFFSWVVIGSGADFVPEVGPEVQRITVSCGDVSVLFRGASQWTPGRFDYKETPMTTERSAYGTVFNFPEVGFIGTAHFENEAEDLKSVRFFIDGEYLEAPEATLNGETFRLERRSKIRAFNLENVTEIHNNRIVETTTISTDEEVPLKLVYHFMHAWSTEVSAYLAVDESSPEKPYRGVLNDTKELERNFFINRTVDWVAVYHKASGQFAVSSLLQKPREIVSPSKIWNVPGAYRKYYLTAFQNRTVPAGFKGTWKMVTAFGSASPDSWEMAAETVAKELTKLPLSPPN